MSAFLDQHCTECHDGDVKKAGLDLTALKWQPEDKQTFDEWVKVFDRVTKNEMPPATKPRPESGAKGSFLSVLERALHDEIKAQQTRTGRTVLRRLNRNEYENTVRDLLGINTPLAGILPEDTPMHGFDTVAEGLRFSQLQMEKYLEAADVAIDCAINLDVEPEQVKKKFFFKDEQGVRKNLDTPVGAVTDKFNPKQKHRHLMLEKPDAIVFFNEGYPPAELRQFNPRTPGRYRFRISGYGYQSKGRAIPIRVYGDNFREKRLLGWFEMPADKAREVEVVAELKSNEHLLIQPSDCGIDEQGRGVYNIGVEEFTGSGLALQWVEVEGPLTESWPPASVKRLFGDTPLMEIEQKKRRYSRGRAVGYELRPVDAKASARTLIESFAGRAFRRPLESGEADRFVRLVETELDAGTTFTDAMRVGFRAILTSPHFLLFQEPQGRLDRWALASRLSYFFWSTMPDEELLAADVTQPEVLRTQTERLLKHPKAENFVRNFTGQWLDLRNIDATTPDKKLYPEFDELLQLSMVAETEAFFAEILRNDLSVAQFIQSDFAMLNRRLAEHYGIDGVQGEQLQRVSLAPSHARGGLLTQASILKVTANGTTTSPVMRGAWVMKRLLGEPPPPPPPAVGSIEPDTRGSTTIREQLAKHRNSETCASCHMNIDPPGFALESFDVIGGYRERYRSQEKGDRKDARLPSGRHVRYMLGQPVDASGEMPDGQKFSGIADFKKLLLARQAQVMRSVTEKLLTYGTGAGISFADRRDVASIAKAAEAKGGGLRTLIHEIVQSDLFQSK